MRHPLTDFYSKKSCGRTQSLIAFVIVSGATTRRSQAATLCKVSTDLSLLLCVCVYAETVTTRNIPTK